jgi:hypothetical protein
VYTSKIDIVEIVLGGLGRIGPAEDRYRWRALVKAVKNRPVPYNAAKLGSG